MYVPGQESVGAKNQVKSAEALSVTKRHRDAVALQAVATTCAGGAATARLSLGAGWLAVLALWAAGRPT